MEWVGWLGMTVREGGDWMDREGLEAAALAEARAELARYRELLAAAEREKADLLAALAVLEGRDEAGRAEEAGVVEAGCAAAVDAAGKAAVGTVVGTVAGAVAEPMAEAETESEDGVGFVSGVGAVGEVTEGGCLVDVAEVEAMAEPMAEAMAEPMAEPVAEAVAEPVAKPVAEPVAESGAEAVAGTAVGRIFSGRPGAAAHKAVAGLPAAGNLAQEYGADFAEMGYLERLALKRNQPQLYAAMRRV